MKILELRKVELPSLPGCEGFGPSQASVLRPGSAIHHKARSEGIGAWGVWGSECRVWDLGCRVEGLGFKV